MLIIDCRHHMRRDAMNMENEKLEWIVCMNVILSGTTKWELIARTNFRYFLHNNKSLTNIYENLHINTILCKQFTSFESAPKGVIKYCYDRCPNECRERIMIIEAVNAVQTIEFAKTLLLVYFNNNYILTYNYVPHMTLFGYFLAAVNLFGLLMGMSITDIAKYLTQSVKSLMRRAYQRTLMNVKRVDIIVNYFKLRTELIKRVNKATAVKYSKVIISKVNINKILMKNLLIDICIRNFHIISDISNCEFIN